MDPNSNVYSKRLYKTAVCISIFALARLQRNCTCFSPSNLTYTFALVHRSLLNMRSSISQRCFMRQDSLHIMTISDAGIPCLAILTYR